MNTDTRQIPDHVLQAAFGQTSLDIWKYDEYRATLRLNDRFFALVTPNGHSTISKEDASKLLAVLNRSSLGQPAAVDWQASLEAGIKRMEAVTVEELAHIYNVSWDAHHSALCKDPLPLEAVRTRLIAAVREGQPSSQPSQAEYYLPKIPNPLSQPAVEAAKPAYVGYMTDEMPADPYADKPKADLVLVPLDASDIRATDEFRRADNEQQICAMLYADSERVKLGLDSMTGSFEYATLAKTHLRRQHGSTEWKQCTKPAP